MFFLKIMLNVVSKLNEFQYSNKINIHSKVSIIFTYLDGYNLYRCMYVLYCKFSFRCPVGLKKVWHGEPKVYLSFYVNKLYRGKE